MINFLRDFHIVIECENSIRKTLRTTIVNVNDFFHPLRIPKLATSKYN